MARASLSKLCEAFLYEMSSFTGQYMLSLPTRHCLFSNLDFSRKLLKETPGIKVVEWAQDISSIVTGGKMNIDISRCGHILTAIFVPVFCSLCIRFRRDGPAYFFDPDFTDGGSKFSLYMPITLCHGCPEVIIEVSQKYDGESIPLTFFYAILNESLSETHGLFTLQKLLAEHIQQRFQRQNMESLPHKLSFVVCGRFLVDEYIEYIYNNQIRKASLGNFELVSLYTKEPKRLLSLLVKVKGFHLLERVF